MPNLSRPGELLRKYFSSFLCKLETIKVSICDNAAKLKIAALGIWDWTIEIAKRWWSPILYCGITLLVPVLLKWAIPKTHISYGNFALVFAIPLAAIELFRGLFNVQSPKVKALLAHLIYFAVVGTAITTFYATEDARHIELDRNDLLRKVGDKSEEALAKTEELRRIHTAYGSFPFLEFGKDINAKWNCQVKLSGEYSISNVQFEIWNLLEKQRMQAEQRSWEEISEKIVRKVPILPVTVLPGLPLWVKDCPTPTNAPYEIYQVVILTGAKYFYQYVLFIKRHADWEVLSLVVDGIDSKIIRLVSPVDGQQEANTLIRSQELTDQCPRFFDILRLQNYLSK